MRFNLIVSLFLLRAGFVEPAFSETFAKTELKPVETISKDFQEFLREIKMGVEKKDARFFEKIIAQDIKFSFGAEKGKNSFLKKYGNLVSSSEFWPAFAKILNMGAVEKPGDGVCMPSLSCSGQWPQQFEPFEFSVVNKQAGKVYEKPDVKGKIVSTVSYLIVKVSYHDNNWLEVTLPDGKIGYMQSSDLQSPTGHRAHFSKRNKTWVLDTFIAGD